MIIVEKPYPLWKLESEEIPKGESKFTAYSVLVKIHKDSSWIELYNSTSELWAKIALNRLQELFIPTILNLMALEEEYCPMFEIHDQIYKTTYVFPNQSCICGENIAGNTHYGEYSIDSEKYDYVRDIIFFYKKGECLVKCNQLFLNGELLLNNQQLKNVCDNINQDLMYLDSSPEKLIKYIKETYPEATSYTCSGYSAFNIKERN